MNESSSASKYIIEEMERLDQELSSLKNQRLEASNQERMNQIEEKSLDEKAADISALLRDFDNYTAAERNEVARRVLSSCVWDYENQTLFLEF